MAKPRLRPADELVRQYDKHNLIALRRGIVASGGPPEADDEWRAAQLAEIDQATASLNGTLPPPPPPPADAQNVDELLVDVMDRLDELAEGVEGLVAGGTPRLDASRSFRGPRTPQSTPQRTPSIRVTDARNQSLPNGEAGIVAALQQAIAAFDSDAFDDVGGKHLAARLHHLDGAPKLGGDSVENAAIIASAQRRALVASGGICVPPPHHRELRVLASTARPVRDALEWFNADKGGIRFFPAPRFGQAAAGTAIWTHSNDVSPSSPATKPIFTVPCSEDETDVRVSAIPARLRFGTFQARYNPELVQAWLETLMADQSALAELTLLAAIDAGSTAVTSPQLFGTVPDVLAVLDRAAAGLRARQRLDRDALLVCIAPSFLLDMMRADLARRAPGDNQLAVLDSAISEMFSARHIRVSFSIDAQRSAFDGQSAGALLGWPSTAVLRLFAAGTHLYLDGGTLDLGVIRTPQLLGTNDAELFIEGFENVATVGYGSLKITASIEASGEAAALVDVDVTP